LDVCLRQAKSPTRTKMANVLGIFGSAWDVPTECKLTHISLITWRSIEQYQRTKHLWMKTEKDTLMMKNLIILKAGGHPRKRC
jgi:hypothetical protein